MILRRVIVPAITVTLMLLLAAVDTAHGQLTWPHWTRTQESGPGDFTLAGNWSNRVPLSTDSFSIDNDGTALFNIDPALSRTVQHMYLGYGNNKRSGFLDHLSGTLKVTGNTVLAAAPDYKAIYTLDGGRLESFSLMTYGAGSPSDAVFRHWNGTVQTAGLSVGNDLHMLGPFGGTYELGHPEGAAIPTLNAGNINVNSLSLFNQTGGNANLDYYSLHGTHRYTGGALQINHGWLHAGLMDFQDAAVSVQPGNALIDLSQSTFANGANASFTSGSKSMVMLSQGFDTSVFGAGWAPGNLTHTVGTAMNIAAGQEWWGWGKVNDHVNAAGIINADGGAIDLMNGLNVSGNGHVSLGTGNLLVEDLTSGMTGGSLMGDYIYIGRTTPGVFTMTSGTCSVNRVWISDEGDGDGSADGTLSVSGDAVLNSTSGIWIGVDGHGTYSQSGGTVTTDTFTPGFGDIEATITVTLTSGVLNTGPVRIASGNDNTATVTHSGGHWTTTGFMNMARGRRTTATYDLSGNAVLDSDALRISDSSYGIGTFNQSGNSLHNVGEIRLGGLPGAESRYNMSGGMLNVRSYIAIYNENLTEFTHTGGTVNADEIRMGPLSWYSTTGFGTYNLGGTGVLVANQVNVGLWTNGEFLQTGGTCTVNGPLSVGAERNYFGNLGEGMYELSGSGQLTTAHTFVGAGGVGFFDHQAGSHGIGGSLVLGRDVSGVGTYNMSGGNLTSAGTVVGRDGTGNFNHDSGTNAISGSLVLGHGETGDGTYGIGGGSLTSAETVVGRDGTGAFNHNAGTNAVSGSLVLGYGETGSGTYRIDGGVLSTPNLIIGRDDGDSHGTGAFIVNNAASLITVSNSMHIGLNGSLQAVEGTVIHMTGSHFSNASVNPAAVAGLGNLKLIFEGGPSQLDTFEVAGRNFGADMLGLEDNFVLHTLSIGGSQIGRLQLVDLFDNQPDWQGIESLYVENLILTQGSMLDLGQINLYYGTLTDHGGMVLSNGGSMQEVPEPATMGLLAIGLAALIRRRQMRGDR